MVIHDSKLELNGNLGFVVAQSATPTRTVRMLDQSEEEVPTCHMTAWLEYAASKADRHDEKEIPWKLARNS